MVLVIAIDIDTQSMVSWLDDDVLLSDLQLGCIHNSPFDIVEGELELQTLDGSEIDVNTDRGRDITPSLFDHSSNISQQRLLNTTFDDTSGRLTLRVRELTGDDRSTDDLGSVDDLLDTRYTQRYVHGGNTGEMESLQSHLGTGFSDRLRTDSTDGGSWLDESSEIFVVTDVKETSQLSFGHLGHVVKQHNLVG